MVSNLPANKLISTSEDSIFNTGDIDDGNDEVVMINQSKTAKSKNVIQLKEIEMGFLTAETRLTFTKLRQAFIKTSFFLYFDPEYHIWIIMNVSGYAIGGVLSQLIGDNSSRWLNSFILLENHSDKDSI